MNQTFMGSQLVNRSRTRGAQTRVGTYPEEDGETKPWRIQRNLAISNTRGAALLILLVFAVYTCTHYKQLTPQRRKFPVMVQSLYLQHALTLSLSQDLPKFIKDRRNHYWLDHGVEAWKTPPGPPEGCIFLNKGASDHYVNCNEFHNIDLTDFWLFPDRHVLHLPDHTKRQSKIRHVGEGGFRNAFYFSEYDGTQRVLKTMSWRDDRPFDIANMERNRKDSVIASQLTFSPLVADIYGYCSQSALVDYSTEWDMYYLFDEDPLPTENELFDLAVDIAQSIADSHLPDDKGRATVVHMDLKPDQFIKLNGKYVLNDFNLAKFITYDEEKGEYCNQASGYSEGRVSRSVVAWLPHTVTISHHLSPLVAST